MDLTTLFEGGGLVIGGAGLKMLFDYLTNRHNARNQRTQIEPDPLRIAHADPAQSAKECHRLRALDRCDRENIFARLSAAEKSNAGLEANFKMIYDSLKRIEDKLP
jgi:hypothetical protein